MLAHAPALTMPVEIGHGRTRNGAGGETFRFSSRRRSDARTLSSRSTVLTPSPAREPCVARPRTSRRNVSAPALAATISPAVGSAMRHASPVCPWRQRAERADPAVLLADDGVDGEWSVEPVADGPHGREDRHDAALHVADAPAVPLVVDLVQVPRVGSGPPLVLARRHDVDVAVQNEGRSALPGNCRRTPTPPRARPPRPGSRDRRAGRRGRVATGRRPARDPAGSRHTTAARRPRTRSRRCSRS